jgi:putative protease
MAPCIAYSGRCLLSGYFNKRDANQGTCTNACRWDYKMEPGMETPEGVWKPERAKEADKVYFLEETNRPGEQMPVMEDEHGTYIMNSKDLRAVEHVQRLVDIGVDSLKIEGRTKSHYYVARATQAYRRAIDDAVAGRPFNPLLLGELENLANRGYTDGFYKRHHTAAEQNFLNSHSESKQQRFVGEILSVDEQGVAEVDVKNRFGVGDSLELITPAGNQSFTLESMEDTKGHAMEAAPGSGYQVRVRIPVSGFERGLLAVNIA